MAKKKAKPKSKPKVKPKAKTKPRKRITVVREHPRHVPVSKKNPDGITIVDRHPRRLEGTYLDKIQIQTIFNSYDKMGIFYPSKHDLGYPDDNKYDEQIAVWTDYFNKKLNVEPPLDPDVVKALIASESGFMENPPGNKVATGIAQITKQTFKALKDPKGEVKDFIFTDINQKDLLDPNIAIPMCVRWLCRKKRLAEGKLGRTATAEEIILEYKGMLKSKTPLKAKALKNFKRHYAMLKAK